MINRGLLGATRLEILELLRREPSTIHELAETLHLSPNAVRSHVIALQRDQLVIAGGRRPGVRKPSAIYTLSDMADQIFGKPYAQTLSAVISDLRERHGVDELLDVLRGIGARMARARIGQVAELRGRSRIEAIAGIMNTLGGLAEVDELPGQYVIRGYDCPLVGIVGDHPEICKLTEALIGGILDEGIVRECCNRGAQISCRFEIGLPRARSNPIPTDTSPN